MFEGINIHLPLYQLLYLTVQTVQTRVFLSSNVFHSHVHMDGGFFQASFDHIFIVFARTLKRCEPLGCQDPPRPLRGLLWGPLGSPWGPGGELREFEELRVVGFG